MKTLFFVSLGTLLIASVLIYAFLPGTVSPVPILYWNTDANPARREQVDLFHQWLADHDHEPFELRMDTANRDISKMIIQGVSGVGSDIMDINRMRYFHSIGLLHDVTEGALRLGFDPSQTSSAIKSDILIDGRQFMYPCIVNSLLYWVNKDVLNDYGISIPSGNWDFDLFEDKGRRFVQAANPSGQRQVRFFADRVNTMVMRRSLGLDVFNETLSASVLNDPRNIEVLELMHRWTHEERILPTAADMASFATEAGWGGINFQLFFEGNYALLWSGRHAVMRFRQLGTISLAACNPPHGGFPNNPTSVRGAGVYAGSRHKDLAFLFLAYLTSKPYNMQIVRSGDGLPPNMLYTRTEEFLRPSEYPNEWGAHEVFAEAVEQIAIPESYSPYVVDMVVRRAVESAEEAFMSGILSAPEAAAEMARRINVEIERTLREMPELRAGHDERQERQRRIEDLRAKGKPVPLEWIENPFHIRYYPAMGWSEHAKTP